MHDCKAGVNSTNLTDDALKKHPFKEVALAVQVTVLL